MNRGLAAWRDDVVIALAFLTRLWPGGAVLPGGLLAHAGRAFPIVGVVVGLLAAAACRLALVLGLAPRAGGGGGGGGGGFNKWRG
ncbi:MAG: hypothetical protein IRY94_18605, partial [Rhodospirillaceae bacterium]|nr:hypothetical protein [Rhodospirillaceae bacterium]